MACLLPLVTDESRKPIMHFLLNEQKQYLLFGPEVCYKVHGAPEFSELFIRPRKFSR